MAKCTIIWDSAIDAYKLQMPFNAQVVNFLKLQIPHSDRKWDPDKKEWIFLEKYFDGTVKFCEMCFPNEVTVISKKQVEEAQAKANAHRQSVTQGKSSPLGDQCLELMKICGYEAAKQMYRKAALLYHPDLIKDSPELRGKMETINQIWARIEKDVYQK